MPSARNLAIDRAARKVPGLRHVPMLKLLALAEILLLAQQHLTKLNPQERRRLLELVRTGRGRRRNLTSREREELSLLISKAQPRQFAASAAQKLSPVRLPGPVVRRVARD